MHKTKVSENKVELEVCAPQARPVIKWYNMFVCAIEGCVVAITNTGGDVILHLHKQV